jgi:hypothetical protein
LQTWAQTAPPPAKEVFIYVEQMPAYPGGQEAMLNFIKTTRCAFSKY